MRNGYFISIEGTDGAGKSTQIQNIQDYLEQLGHEVMMLREPGGTLIGEQIREVLLLRENNAMVPLCEMFLYAASRAQLVAQMIRPALEMGKIVICDRFIDSSLAYQGYARGLSFQTVWDVNALGVGQSMPHLTLFFDLSPGIAMKRVRSADRPLDRMENEAEDFYNQVYMGYRDLAQRFPDRIKCIDADKGIDDIFYEVKHHLDCLFNKEE